MIHCTQFQEVRSCETELQLLQNLRHERIVTYYGTDIRDGKLCIFMEFMLGVRPCSLGCLLCTPSIASLNYVINAN